MYVCIYTYVHKHAHRERLRQDLIVYDERMVE